MVLSKKIECKQKARMLLCQMEFIMYISNEKKNSKEKLFKLPKIRIFKLYLMTSRKTKTSMIYVNIYLWCVSVGKA